MKLVCDVQALIDMPFVAWVRFSRAEPVTHTNTSLRRGTRSGRACQEANL